MNFPMQFCEKLRLRLHSQVSTQILKQSEFINARHALQNFLDQIQNFIPAVAGRLFMHQPRKMQLN